MKEPLISIITVTYNSEKYLQSTIDSIKSQTYKNIEFIIVDGASEDDTLSIAALNEEIISCVISEPDESLYDAMNKGINMANGDIIGIVNSDDWLEKDCCDNVAMVYKNALSRDIIIHGNIRTHDPKSSLTNVRRPPRGFLTHLWSTPFKHPAMFVCKGLYNQYGYFDLDKGLAADYDLMLRFTKAKVRDIYINETLSNVRLVGLSTGGNQNASLKLLYRIIRENYNSFYGFIGVFGRIIIKLRRNVRNCCFH